jgi:hypothetical protein
MNRVLWSAIRAIQILAVIFFCPVSFAAESPNDEQKLLYVAEPGIRDYLEYGGHGIIVFDIERNHQFVRRIPTPGVDEKGKPLNVKGICASTITKRLYISTTRTLICLDLLTDAVLYEKAYPGGCDRMALSPDGKTMYLPSLEGDHWHVVDALTGEILDKIVTRSGAHNTIYAADGSCVYLAGLKSPILTVIDPKTTKVSGIVGPFGNVIRPFTVNGSQTLCFVNVNASGI